MSLPDRQPARLARAVLLLVALGLVGLAVVAGLQPSRILPVDGGALPYAEAIERDDREGRPEDAPCVGECGPGNPAAPPSELPGYR